MKKEKEKNKNKIISLLVIINVLFLITIIVLVNIKIPVNILGFTNNEKYEAEKINRLDINKDGLVDITDVLALKRHVLAATTNDTEDEWYIADQEIDTENATSTNSVSDVVPVSEKTTYTDEYGNKYVVPKGFGIAKDSGRTVPEGIVIEDVTHENTVGSQFVWVPVGTIYTSNGAERESTKKEIILGRYTFNSKTGEPTLQQNSNDYTSIVTIDREYQELVNSSYGNTAARALGLFIESAKNNGGYYMARYEAGVKGTNSKMDTSDGRIVSQKNMDVWNYITQAGAAIVSKRMYSQDITSDLMNSYAWDTAIVYIQKCGNKANSSNYSNTKGNTLEGDSGGVPKTGTCILDQTGLLDEQCNIYDMASGIREWTTETNISGNESYSPCAHSGGCYWGCYTSYRFAYNTEYNNYVVGFRPILYL